MTTGLGAVATALGGQSNTETHLGGNADPKFDDWDGSPYTLASWIRNNTHYKDIRGTTDRVAIKYARLKLAQFIREIYPSNAREQPQTWEAFIQWLQENFYPQHWGFQARLNLARGGVVLRGNNLRQYITDFLAARAECDAAEPLDDETAKGFFMNGLSSFPYLQYSILHDWKGGNLRAMLK
jgi:hypothetical protein